MIWDIGAIEAGGDIPVPPISTDGRPPAPSLQAPPTSTAPVTIAWNAIANVTGYNVYRAASPDQLTNPLTSVAPSSTSYVDGSVQSGITYYYAVTAFDPNKESALSNVVAVLVTNPTPIPPIPTPIPPTANVVTVTVPSGRTVRVVKNRIARSYVEVHVNKGDSVVVNP